MNLNSTYKNQKGISLIETVVAILLIGVISLSFFGILIQSKKTGKAAEHIIDATYIAQQTMEEIYYLSATYSYNEVVLYYTNASHPSMPPQITPTKSIFQLPDTSNNTNIVITFEQSNSDLKSGIGTTLPKLYNVIVEVFEKSIIKSSMENIYQFS